jgi:hypothetical protein
VVAARADESRVRADSRYNMIVDGVDVDVLWGVSNAKGIVPFSDCLES